MNCRQWQEKIVEFLAAGESLPAAELAVHLNSCASCREFSAEQQKLFFSIDSGLRSLANAAVPSSFLLSVRDRLDERPAPDRALFYGWSLAAAAAVLLAISAAYTQHRSRPVPTANVLKPALSASLRPRKPPSFEPPHPSEATKASVLPVKHSETAAIKGKMPEVIVLAEEREAFAKFVAEAANEPDVAVGLTRPAQAVTSDATEIALLRIDPLEVKPLESGATEE